MGGGDLNLKKSWHPLTHHNLEKVWKAEQNAEKEKAKLDQLRKEKQQERELEELQRLHAPGNDGKKQIEKLDWMYAGSSTATSSGIAEEYLLGKRRVDSCLDNDKQPTSLKKFQKNTQTLLVDDQAALDKDLLKRIREDPMFRIKQHEQTLKKKRALIKKVKKP